jgi:hypothetical protein
VFTQTDLIRYLYQETTETEKKEIDKALLLDGELMTLYNELCAMMKAMDQVQLQPSTTTVFNILNYSRSLQEKHQ